MARHAARAFPSSWARANARNRNRYRASSVVKAALLSARLGWSSERMGRLWLQVWDVPRCRYNSGIGHTRRRAASPFCLQALHTFVTPRKPSVRGKRVRWTSKAARTARPTVRGGGAWTASFRRRNGSPWGPTTTRSWWCPRGESDHLPSHGHEAGSDREEARGDGAPGDEHPSGRGRPRQALRPVVS